MTGCKSELVIEGTVFSVAGPKNQCSPKKIPSLDTLRLHRNEG